MILYDKSVKWSVFDGEITLQPNARKMLLQTILYEKHKNIDIWLDIQNKRYKARLMNVKSSSSVQISYGNDVKTCLRKIFSYSAYYYDDLIKRTNRKTPYQTFEWLTVHDTNDPKVFRFECRTYDLTKTLNQDADNFMLEEVNHELSTSSLVSTFRGDIQKKRGTPINSGNRKIYPRNKQTAINALQNANFCCEFDSKHKSFISKSSGKNYMEPHHLIPMSESDNYSVSLDVEANIVSLCSHCHNQIHYGYDKDDLIKKLYNDRIHRLKKVGIDISLQDILDIYQ